MRYLIIVLLLLVGCKSTKSTEPTTPVATSSPPVAAMADFIGEMKQTTFDGRRAGEGYFRADGYYFVFQSERDTNNPFYQIYLTDLRTKETRRISPGRGKTTCAWIHPKKERVLFASTHADPKLEEKAKAEWEERRNPKSRYNWSFDDAYDIYETDFKGRILRNLTASPGYDAEGSYSPDGQWIAFASNRAAYTEQLSPADQKAFERDPAYMMDLYIMKADGSELKRLTMARGYDGGPFFSPDGQRITFRRFSSDGHTAEVYTIGVDGRDEKQITRLKTMSWAPFYHPSGDYLIFTSSLFGHDNFELFIVDVNGEKAPIRVTDMKGFDGLPVFRPDGQSLVWTHANSGGEGQLYQANWNDASARRALGLPPRRPAFNSLSSEIRQADAKSWVEYLSQEKFAGRMTGAETEKEYARALGQAFFEMGLNPAVGREFDVPFNFTSGVNLGPNNNLTLNIEGVAEVAVLEKDWIPISESATGEYAEAPVIFAGYGIKAPEGGGEGPYDSYAGLNVKDKWVLVFSGVPNQVSNERRYHLNLYAKVSHKALMARQNGARGLLIVDDNEALAHPLKITFEGRSQDVGIPVVEISPRLGEKLFKAVGTSRAEWTGKLAKGEWASLNLDKVVARSQIDLQFTTGQARNVVAVLGAPGAKKTVVIGAHMDHLGRGERGTSLARGGGIHFGADDNASGVAAIMEIAHALSEEVKKGRLKLKENVVFALWSGEEIGILGSSQFLKENKTYAISSHISLDMVGRLREKLIVQGVGSANEWRGVFEKWQSQSKLNLAMQNDPYVPSDSLSFYLKGIPAITLFTGSHSEYHTPNDRPELINYDGLVSISKLANDVIRDLVSATETRLTYQNVEGGSRGESVSGSRGFRLYLGTIPNYSDETQSGVAISGTSKDSPAEKAGLRSGDVIVELGGIKIKSLSDYAYCLQALKANEPAKVRVLRAGKEVELEIVPRLKVQ